jgi:AcrR family transcriptional regulator
VPRSPEATSGRAYHHGDLRAELVRTAQEIIGEVGVAQFSVAEAARRIGVSPGAPSRHFASRDDLLAAVGAEVAGRLADRFRAAIADSDDPAEQLAATAEAYADMLTAALGEDDRLPNPVSLTRA